MSFKPLVSWSVRVENVVLSATDYQFICDIVPLDPNEPGWGDVAIGDILLSNDGYPFEVMAVTGYEIEVKDITLRGDGTNSAFGPVADKRGYIYRPENSDELFSQAQLRKLDTSAADIIQPMNSVQLMRILGNREYTEQNYITDKEAITASLDILDVTIALQYLDAGGADTELQYNNSGKLGGAAITYNNATKAVTVEGAALFESTLGFTLGTTINEISTDGTLTGNSDDAVPTEKAVKTYVDNAVVGYEWIVATVVAATTGNITIATALNDGDVLDGVTLVADDYVLVKNQTTKAQNGLYVVGASPARAPEMDAAGEFKNKAMLVTGGTINAGSSWVCVSTVTTVDTDDVEFAKLSQSVSYTAGDNIDITGTEISAVDVVTTDTPQSISGIKTFSANPVLSADTAILSFSSAVGVKTISTGGSTNLALLPGGEKLYTPLSVEVNGLGSGNRFAYVDLIGDDTYSDYGFRIIRNNTGANAITQLIHRGTSQLQIQTTDAAPIRFVTSNTFRAIITSDGKFGINRVTPAYTLDVEGDINISSGFMYKINGVNISTTNISEGINLYYTDARARTSISLTTTGTSGAATYVPATGILNIPQYQAALTNPITGTGTVNQIAYFTGATSLASLSTVTYPSLTELSYVKGVTSALQTQLTGKISTTLASTNILVGSSGNVATARALSLSATTGTFGLSNTGVLTMPNATTSLRGLLTSTDWNTFNGKQDTITGGASSIVTNNLLTSRALVSDSSGKVTSSPVTTTEIGYVDGVTSPIQTQLNGKDSILTFTKSLSRVTNTVELVNDSTSPGNSKYYGTNSSGTKGFHDIPVTLDPYRDISGTSPLTLAAGSGINTVLSMSVNTTLNFSQLYSGMSGDIVVTVTGVSNRTLTLGTALTYNGRTLTKRYLGNFSSNAIVLAPGTYHLCFTVVVISTTTEFIDFNIAEYAT